MDSCYELFIKPPRQHLVLKRWVGGWLSEWAAAEPWGDKGLVCMCNAMTFHSLEKKNEHVLEKNRPSLKASKTVSARKQQR